ncbi:MAG: hypothetical protein FWE67_08355, partial [Planctomycetaceae bacterium]|nr:hypothetical protein [Planctomycetaceae bacterium]
GRIGHNILLRIEKNGKNNNVIITAAERNTSWSSERLEAGSERADGCVAAIYRSCIFADKHVIMVTSEGDIMKNLYRILFVVLFFGTVSSAWAERDDKLSEDNQAVIKEKRKKIENEIALLKDHPWAGRYYHGNGLGANVMLTLAPKNGFTITWFGCMGLYDQNHGTVEWNEDSVKFSFAFGMESGYIGNYAAEYKPIRWGNRLYLIPTSEIIAFCNAVNSGNEPRKGVNGFFFLQWGDEKKEVKGKPELPEKFMPYLLDKPVDAAIVSIKDTQEKKGATIATVVVNKGKADGLLPGMQLHVIKPKDVYEEVVLTLVGEKQSEGKYVYGRHHETVFRTPAPAKGWQLSTRPSWRR